GTRLPARRAAADGGIPHPKRTGAADEPREAWILGGATRARRGDSPAAGRRSRTAERRGEVGSAAAGRAGAAPQQSCVRRLSRALRCLWADAGKLWAGWRNAYEGSGRTPGRYTGLVSRRGSGQRSERPPVI